MKEPDAVGTEGGMTEGNGVGAPTAKEGEGVGGEKVVSEGKAPDTTYLPLQALDMKQPCLMV